MNINEFKNKRYILNAAKENIENELSVELRELLVKFLTKVKEEHGELPSSITIDFIESFAIGNIEPSYILGEIKVII